MKKSILLLSSLLLFAGCSPKSTDQSNLFSVKVPQSIKITSMDKARELLDFGGMYSFCGAYSKLSKNADVPGHADEYLGMADNIFALVRNADYTGDGFDKADHQVIDLWKKMKNINDIVNTQLTKKMAANPKMGVSDVYAIINQKKDDQHKVSYTCSTVGTALKSFLEHPQS
ncbi:hypothetical protein KDN34_14740 [Shewanella yunxiaonensis]|uniref:Lipoprotein n=1 Tax=Shewanella yunxiaonensis TaxID=2829809 RepID=A0ABX7YRM4_9GAMM|nr:hypothetical protein [Shewanella yunxiaonensis]QUN05433.1 hypothetical protein KDN34_14740 [Shewanella yunxiaonensis]